MRNKFLWILLVMVVSLASLGNSASTTMSRTLDAKAPHSANHAPGNVLVNGDFESGPGVGWTQSSPGHYQLVTTERPHTGIYSAHLYAPVGSFGAIQQTVTLPANGRLTYWWYQYLVPGRPSGTADPCTSGADKLEVELWSTDNHWLTTLRCWDESGPLNVWSQDSLDVSAYAGQTVNLRFTNSHYSNTVSSFYVDDVILETNPDAPVMHVAAIDPFYRQSGNHYTVGAIFAIEDSAGAPVPAVSATVDVTLPDSQTVTVRTNTDSNGRFWLAGRTSQPGTYTFTVANLRKPGWTYDPSHNVETSDSETIPGQ